MIVCVLSVVAFLAAAVRVSPLAFPTAAGSAIMTAAHDDDAPRISEERGELCRPPAVRARSGPRSGAFVHAVIAPGVDARVLATRRSVMTDASSREVESGARPRTRAELMVFHI